MSEIAKDRADWLLDAIAGATQDRRFLRGDPEYDAIAGEAILLNAEKAIQVALSRSQSERVSRLEEALRGLIEAIDDLTGNSSGVSGLHMNGDLAPWDELLNDGRYTEWLGDPLNAARSALNQGADDGR